MATSTVEADAIPYTFNDTTNQPEHKLDPILNTLTVDDYRSILFLLIDRSFNKEDFLFLVKQDKDFLKRKFLVTYYDYRFKDALLIEIFGTMQKYNLLKHLGTCDHIFLKDKETFTQLSSLWKFLYAVCEQLEDGEVDHLKERMFPESLNMNVCCAEELICLAFTKGKLEENSWQDKLADVFKSFHPDCSKFISSYKGCSLNYYPIRRPFERTAPCGIAVIMNHVKFTVPHLKERPESNADASALKKLWEAYGFKTTIYTDLIDTEVIEVFQKLTTEDHSNFDAFIACYLSHGDEGGIVFAKNGEPVNLNALVDLIANHCDTLVGKPKLFFVQACQGCQIQTGVGGVIHSLSSGRQVQPSRLSLNVALLSDVLMFTASIDGYVSYRNLNGSWFINSLVSEMEHGEEFTIGNVLTKVVEKVSGKKGTQFGTNVPKCKQTPVSHNTLKFELKLKKCCKC